MECLIKGKKEQIKESVLALESFHIKPFVAFCLLEKVKNDSSWGIFIMLWFSAIFWVSAFCCLCNGQFRDDIFIIRPPYKDEIPVKWGTAFYKVDKAKWNWSGRSRDGERHWEMGRESDKIQYTRHVCQLRAHFHLWFKEAHSKSIHCVSLILPSALYSFWSFKWHLKKDRRFLYFSKGKQWHMTQFHSFLATPCIFLGIFIRHYLRLLVMVIWSK